MTKIILKNWKCLFCGKIFTTKEIEKAKCCPNCKCIDFNVEIWFSNKKRIKNE